MTDTILAVEDLEKTYPGSNSPVRAVDGVSFQVDRGEVVGVLGPNGAGKTTTIKCILGLILPTSGTVRVDGIDPTADPSAAYRRVSAVLEGARNVYWRLTVRENLRFFVGCQGVHPNEAEERYDRLISMVGLEDKEHEQLRHLSRGMQQKASLACALVGDADLLFLDEPTLGLDVEASYDLRQEIRRLADEEQRTIVLSSHDMTVVQELCDRVIILNDGEIVADDTVERLTDLLDSRTYHVAFAPGTMPDGRLAAFDVTPVEKSEFPTVEVAFASSEEFYEFVETCRSAGAEIELIQPAGADLEDVFLDLTEQGTDGARTAVPAGNDAR